MRLNREQQKAAASANGSRPNPADPEAHAQWSRRLGVGRALVSTLERWCSSGLGLRSISLLDVGTGSLDAPVAARRWALDQGVDLRVTAFGSCPLYRDQLASNLSRYPPEIVSGITLESDDPLELVDRFGLASFDVVHAGLFLHAMRDINALNLLRQMDRAGRLGVVWSDPLRSLASRSSPRAMTLGMGPEARRIAIAGWQSGLTRAAALDMARRVGLTNPRCQASMARQRFTLTSFKDDATWRAEQSRTA
ncbi:MAG: hypothetical protein KDB18_12600 [Salinibacterium sp.]|nr:hypothetical protein [Salinibacterium sp.]